MAVNPLGLLLSIIMFIVIGIATLIWAAFAVMMYKKGKKTLSIALFIFCVLPAIVCIIFGLTSVILAIRLFYFVII